MHLAQWPLAEEAILWARVAQISALEAASQSVNRISEPNELLMFNCAIVSQFEPFERKRGLASLRAGGRSGRAARPSARAWARPLDQILYSP